MSNWKEFLDWPFLRHFSLLVPVKTSVQVFLARQRSSCCLNWCTALLTPKHSNLFYICIFDGLHINRSWDYFCPLFSKELINFKWFVRISFASNVCPCFFLHNCVVSNFQSVWTQFMLLTLYYGNGNILQIISNSPGFLVIFSHVKLVSNANGAL